MTVSCACGVVAVLVVVLCAGMSFDAGPKSSFLKYCGSCGQARCCLIEEANNGKSHFSRKKYGALDLRTTSWPSSGTLAVGPAGE